jgi:hypothetical protein
MAGTILSTERKAFSMTTNPEQTPPARRRGIYVENAWVAAAVVLVVVGVIALGYFTVIQVFGVPWYAAVPLSLLAGAGIVLREMTFSWKAWLLAAVLTVLAVASGLGYYLSQVA